MAVDTVNRTFPARDDGTQNVMTLRYEFNFNDGGISSGVKFGTIPQNAFIHSVDVEIITAFNAAGTNVVTSGSTATGTNIVAAADVDETTAGNYNVPRAAGRGLTANGDLSCYVRYTQTSTAATTGKAQIVIRWSPPTAH